MIEKPLTETLNSVEHRHLWLLIRFRAHELLLAHCSYLASGVEKRHAAASGLGSRTEVSAINQELEPISAAVWLLLPESIQALNFGEFGFLTRSTSNQQANRGNNACITMVELKNHLVSEIQEMEEEIELMPWINSSLAMQASIFPMPSVPLDEVTVV